LAEYSKYDILTKELTLIEVQVSVLNNKYKDAVARNQELEEIIEELQKENALLNKKIAKLESEPGVLQIEGNQTLFSSLNTKEREDLKIKLKSFISKIDNHISS
jgi:peptidoglycan hydrolase CwlO-like protein